MLRITRSSETDSAVTIKVEGQIASDWVPVLEEEVRSILKTGRSAVLDLSQVSHVDFTGVKMLRLLAGRVEIAACSPLIRKLLKSYPRSQRRPSGQ